MKQWNLVKVSEILDNEQNNVIYPNRLTLFSSVLKYSFNCII